MPAPDNLHLLKAVVLPQPSDRRNGNIVTDGGQRCRHAALMRWFGRGLACLLALTGNVACGDSLDWHYRPHQDDRMVRVTETRPPGTARDTSPNPVVMPQPLPYERRHPSSDEGWFLTNPQLATGRPDAFQDNREAVRIAQAQQDQALLQSHRTPSSLDQLPDAFQGLNYRIELGLLYRF